MRLVPSMRGGLQDVLEHHVPMTFGPTRCNSQQQSVWIPQLFNDDRNRQASALIQWLYKSLRIEPDQPTDHAWNICCGHNVGVAAALGG